MAADSQWGKAMRRQFLGTRAFLRRCYPRRTPLRPNRVAGARFLVRNNPCQRDRPWQQLSEVSPFAWRFRLPGLPAFRARFVRERQDSFLALTGIGTGLLAIHDKSSPASSPKAEVPVGHLKSKELAYLETVHTEGPSREDLAGRARL